MHHRLILIDCNSLCMSVRDPCFSKVEKNSFTLLEGNIHFMSNNKALKKSCFASIGDAIAILMLAIVVIFFSLLMKLFFKAKAAKTAL